MKKVVEFKNRLSGYFLLEAVQRDGSRRFLAEIDNLVMDAGLDHFGVNSVGTSNSTHWFHRCQVGTSNADPFDTTKTNLVSFFAGHIGTTLPVSGVAFAAAVPPYIEWTGLYNFDFGQIDANLFEISIGPGGPDLAVGVPPSNPSTPPGPTPAANKPTPIFCRAIIAPAITVLPTEALSVTYKCRMYPPSGPDVEGTVTIGSQNYDYDMRAADIDGSSSVGWLEFVEGSGIRDVTAGGNIAVVYATNILGPIDGSPSTSGGSGVGFRSISNGPLPTGWTVPAYVAGNYFREYTLKVALAQGNMENPPGTPASWGALRFRCAMGDYQLNFTPKIPKTSLNQFTLTFRVTWARYP